MFNIVAQKKRIKFALKFRNVEKSQRKRFAIKKNQRDRKIIFFWKPH